MGEALRIYAAPGQGPAARRVEGFSSLILTRIPKGIPPHPGPRLSAADPPPNRTFLVCPVSGTTGSGFDLKSGPQGIPGEALKSLKSGKGRPWDPPGKGPWKKEGPGLHFGPPQVC